MTKLDKKIKYIIGVDEVGRGPLAGPVTVGAYLVLNPEIKSGTRQTKKKSHVESFISEISKKHAIRLTDSKGLNKKQREIWNAELLNMELKNDIENIFISSVKSMPARTIDRIGISKCIHRLIDEVLKDVLNILHTKTKGSVSNLEEVHVYLDGGLKAPPQFINQSTHVKGDVLFPVISFASIRAKITRDSYMEKISKRYPEYGFAKHKGYGTKEHRGAIGLHGASDVHRISFCGRILDRAPNKTLK